MTQEQRDRLVALKKAKKGLITQKQAAEEIGVSERQVRRLLKRLKKQGDGVVVHGLKGKPSNRRISARQRERIVQVLSREEYRDFGPTLAAEYLAKLHHIAIGREALRQIMMAAGLWKGKKRKVGEVHVWRPRRERFGELVQWDTSDHEWLEGRGEKIYLIHMIDDATSLLRARFVRHDSTEENLVMLRNWLAEHGRPLAFYTDKDGMFYNPPKRVDGADISLMPPTQIGRALQELQIAFPHAHSPQAKGRVERSFQTAQDRLVKGLRIAGARTLEQANAYLQAEFVPWWNATLTVAPACRNNAHRPCPTTEQVERALSIVESRRLDNDYTFRYYRQKFQIARDDIRTGLRKARVRVEKRMDGSLAVAHERRYLRFSPCLEPEKYPREEPPTAPAKARPRSRWMAGFDLQKSPPVWAAARDPERTSRS